MLVSWTDSDEISELGEDAIGLGGDSPVIADGGDAVFVTGLIYLDGPAIADVLDRPEGRDQTRAIIMHELGHMLGLDHVEDPSKLMNGEGHPGIIDFGAGDRAGLARLGAGQCFPDV